MLIYLNNFPVSRGRGGVEGGDGGVDGAAPLVAIGLGREDFPTWLFGRVVVVVPVGLIGWLVGFVGLEEQAAAVAIGRRARQEVASLGLDGGICTCALDWTLSFFSFRLSLGLPVHLSSGFGNRKL